MSVHWLSENGRAVIEFTPDDYGRARLRVQVGRPGEGDAETVAPTRIERIREFARALVEMCDTAEGVDVGSTGDAKARIEPAHGAPRYDQLARMTRDEKATLPAGYHTPIVVEVGERTEFACAVCWGVGEVAAWPCEKARRQPREVFQRS